MARVNKNPLMTLGGLAALTIGLTVGTILLQDTQDMRSSAARPAGGGPETSFPCPTMVATQSAKLTEPQGGGPCVSTKPVPKTSAKPKSAMTPKPRSIPIPSTSSRM